MNQDEWSKWESELTTFLQTLAQRDDDIGRQAEGLGQFLPTLRTLNGPLEQQPVWAWQHADDDTRVISAAQKAQAMRDGGASASSVRKYSTPLYRAVLAARQADEPSDEQICAAIDAALPVLDYPAQKELTFTRWRNGIDIQYPTVKAMKFVEAIFRHLSQRQQ